MLLGDFNIFSRDDDTYRSIVNAGFELPEALQEIPGSNVKKNKHYDQIAVMSRPERFGLTGRAGVFDFYEYVFRDHQADAYSAAIEATGGEKVGFAQWRTYQMSDHLLMWCELAIDHSTRYLKELRAGADVEAPEVTPD